MRRRSATAMAGRGQAQVRPDGGVMPRAGGTEVVIDTRPKAPRTGVAVEGCYAGALLDCGGELTGEHYASKNVLKQLGKAFTIKGPPWAPSDTKVSPESLTAHVLCKRHNNALSGLDEVAGKFYPLMLSTIQGKRVGVHEFDGEDLERWAIKLMLGVAVSGNTTYPGLTRLRPDQIPLEYLRVLFGECEMADGCGLKYSAAPVDQSDSVLSWNLHHLLEGPQAGEIFGISIKIANWFQFLTTVTLPVTELNGVHQWHRPNGFVLLGPPEVQGEIKLRWGGKSMGGSLIMRRRVTTPPTTTTGGSK